jgi:hypothetical protein
MMDRFYLYSNNIISLMDEDRRDFIKAILTGLPLYIALTEVINLSRRSDIKLNIRRIKVMETNIAGLYYYEGYQNFELLKENDSIFLKPQKNNPYDRYAVEIFHNKSAMKLGYIPRYQNIAISSMLIDGLKIDGQISRLAIDRIMDYKDVIVSLYLNL